MRTILFFVMWLPIIGFGQGWEMKFDSIAGSPAGGGESVQQTTDGGYIITGYSAYGKLFLLQTDSNGIEQWSKLFHPQGCYPYELIKTSDGGYAICGSAFFNNQHDFYLLKTDLNGDSLWSRTYGTWTSEVALDLDQTNDGGYIMCGGTGGYGSLVKTDHNGLEQWTQIYAPGGWAETFRSVKQTNDGGYIICGHCCGPISGALILKTDSNGIQQWSQSYEDTVLLADTYGEEIELTIDGGYIITGWSNQSLLLLKTDENGVEQWRKYYDQLYQNSRGYSVKQTIDEGYIICGEKYIISATDTTSDLYLMKTNSNGDSLWTRTFGSINTGDAGASVQQTTDGGYIITGSAGIGPSPSLYLIKTDEYGNTMSTLEIPMQIEKRKLKKIVNFLGQEINPHPGIPIIEIYNDGTIEKKIIID